MVSAKRFFTKQQQGSIVEEIKKAEAETFTEIRVHLEKACPKDPLERAKEVFLTIGMDKTQKRSGVLIYLCIKDKKFAIIADTGVHKYSSDGYWQTLVSKTENYFKNGEFFDGICFAIKDIAEILKRHLPYPKNDKNELPNNISF